MPTFNLSSPDSLSRRSSYHSSSSSLSDPPVFWLGSSKSIPSASFRGRWKATRSKLYQLRRQIAVLIVILLSVFVWFAPPPSSWGGRPVQLGSVSTLRAAHIDVKDGPDPVKWLKENSGDRHAVTEWSSSLATTKPRAALISLVRNQELDGMIQSMTQLEYHWNHKYQYPWVFFNDEPFNEEFKVCSLPTWTRPRSCARKGGRITANPRYSARHRT